MHVCQYNKYLGIIAQISRAHTQVSLTRLTFIYRRSPAIKFIGVNFLVPVIIP